MLQGVKPGFGHRFFLLFGQLALASVVVLPAAALLLPHGQAERTAAGRWRWPRPPPPLPCGDEKLYIRCRNKFEIPGLWIPALSQDRTDLQKALDWCIEYNVSHVTILGAGGGREEHTLGNMHNLAEYDDKMNLKMVTNHATIICVQGKKSITTYPGQAVSIMAIHSVNSISVSGLKYPIVDEKLLPSSRAICNETLSNKFSLNTTDTVWVFINHPD